MVWGWLLGAVVVVVFGWWFFHRDPDRYSPPLQGYVSPADGVVAKVIDVDGDTFVKKGHHGWTSLIDDFPDARKIIVIHLKVWHVHTQRAPCGGTISNVSHKDGAYRNAVFGDWESATVENEHWGATVTGEKQCRVYLIAGLLARRIVPMVDHGDRVKQGQRIGRIKLGSQCALVLPACDVKVEVGQTVYGGLTEVAR